MTRHVPGRVRQFPRPVRPYPAETLRSYLDRLAHANHQPLAEVIDWLSRPTGDRGRPALDPQRLAAATARSAEALARALPELTLDVDHRGRRRPPGGFLPTPRPACRACAGRRVVAIGPIDHWVRPTGRLCVRHRRWLGATGYGDPQPSLDPATDVLRAHRRLRRLLQRRGLTAATQAYAQAEHIVLTWCERGVYRRHRDRRIDQLAGRATVAVPSAAVEAACYPDIVALAPIIASPDAVTAGLDVGFGHPAHLYTQVGRAIGFPDFEPYGAHDPFTAWLRTITDHIPAPTPPVVRRPRLPDWLLSPGPPRRQ